MAAKCVDVSAEVIPRPQSKLTYIGINECDNMYQKDRISNVLISEFLQAVIK